MESYEVKEKALSAVIFTACSLFSQWAHWFIYEKAEFSVSFIIFTPLVLCFMYRLVMADCERGGSFKKGFVFAFAVLVPLALSLILSVYMMLSYPDMTVFSATEPEKGTPREIITIYSGRFVLTSLYLMVYAALDALIISKIAAKLKR